MPPHKRPASANRLYRIATALIGTAVVAIAGCAKQATPGTTQASSSTPEEAVTALVAAVEKNDAKELRELLGPGTENLLSSGDDVADRTAHEAFLKRYRTRHQLVPGGVDDLVLQVGEDDWPSPIPLVRSNGQWRLAMSFMVNQDGVVWQRDLGEATAQVAASMRQFNPDNDWTPIAQDD